VERDEIIEDFKKQKVEIMQYSSPKLAFKIFHVVFANWIDIYKYHNTLENNLVKEINYCSHLEKILVSNSEIKVIQNLVIEIKEKIIPMADLINQKKDKAFKYIKEHSENNLQHPLILEKAMTQLMSLNDEFRDFFKKIDDDLILIHSKLFTTVLKALKHEKNNALKILKYQENQSTKLIEQLQIYEKIKQKEQKTKTLIEHDTKAADIKYKIKDIVEDQRCNVHLALQKK